MKPQLLPLFASLLLVAPLFPGLSRALDVNRLGTEAPRRFEEGSLGQGTNGSHVLHHQAKREFLPPRTPPYK
ncbi:sperm-associated antigen 11-like, partial [Carlito syrichta]|uniref:Sperm-associated antigen 11-like n=1 Tax=Carlito syrichta TaxID=1868482 RepID=A0A3Q0DTM6_CARSF